ncbi:hypothetical protein ACJMK2_024949 [Sinanodonta woodiana]|uniref:Uncharacterized protein n=1 Tax=Sinanodonta woodiana TaxID=1069815 RepID=A0ABD3XIW2_SINWO
MPRWQLKLITIANGYMKVGHRDNIVVTAPQWKNNRRNKNIKRNSFTNDSWKEHLPVKDLPLISEIEEIIVPRKRHKGNVSVSGSDITSVADKTATNEFSEKLHRERIFEQKLDGLWEQNQKKFT